MGPYINLQLLPIHHGGAVNSTHGKLFMGDPSEGLPGLMHSSDSVFPVSDSRPTSGWYRNRRLLLASLTGSKRRGTLTTAPGLVPSPRHPGGCRLHQKIFERSKCSWWRRQQYPSSSTTHSVTGPAPSASMVENPANALSLSVLWIQFIVFILYIPIYHGVSIRYISAFIFGCPFCRS